MKKLIQKKKKRVYSKEKMKKNSKKEEEGMGAEINFSLIDHFVFLFELTNGGSYHRLVEILWAKGYPL